MTTLRITDGTTTISLTSSYGQSGYFIEDWPPAIAAWKGGGTYQDSPLSDGKRLVAAVRDNVVETFNLKLRGLSQDDAIRWTQDLRRLLERAKDYWCTPGYNQPVWIEVQASRESNKRYAIVVQGALTGEGNPFGQPFLQGDCSAVMDALSLIVERGEWCALPPGTDEAVDLSYSYTAPVPIDMTVLKNGAFAANTIHADVAPDGTIYATADGGRVYRSVDNGANWVLCQTLAGVTFPYAGALSITSTGTVYLVGVIGAGGVNIYKSTDRCGSVNVVYTSAAYVGGAIQAITDNIIVAALRSATFNAVLRTVNAGSSWSSVYTGPGPGIITDGVLLSTGTVLFATKSGTNVDVYFGTVLGATWTYSRIDYLAGSTITRLFETSSQTVIMCRGSMIGHDYTHVSYDHGLTWTQMTTTWWIGSGGMTQDGFGYLFTNGGGNVMVSVDGLVWDVVSAAAAGSWTLALSNGTVLVGETTNVWVIVYNTSSTTTTTTLPTALVANKSNVANITNVVQDDGGVQTGITTWPATLLPAVPAVNDAIYFGCNTATFNSGPFCSLWFNLSTPVSSTTSYTIVWEYYKTSGGAGWATLVCTDNTSQLSVTGIKTVSWSQEQTLPWIVCDPGIGVTGYWVRARVSALTGTMTPPIAADAICTITIPYVDTSDVVGDLPALAMVTVVPVSDKDGVGATAPDLYLNRVICGLRQVNRGDWFDAYLNAASEQNQFGVTVSYGTNTATDASVIYATGNRAKYDPPASVDAMANRVTWTLSTTVAQHYYGTFHAFMRGMQSGGTIGDISVRLVVSTGSGGISWTSETMTFATVTDHQLIDFGRITLPVSGLFESDEVADVTTLTIQASNSLAAGTSLLYVYDLILIPTDEWAGDFYDTVNTASSTLGYDKMLIVDSVGNPRKAIAAKVKAWQRAGLVKSIWETVANGPLVLRPNSEQRLWFLTARTYEIGSNPDWRSEPYVLCQVQLYKNERYFSARGNR